MFRLIFIVLIILLTGEQCHAMDNTNPVRIKLSIGSLDIKDKKLEVAVKVTIQNGWHIYYKTPGDLGLPTSFQWQEELFKDVQIHWPKPLRHTDIVNNNVFHSNIYKDMVVFPISFTLRDSKHGTKELNTILRIKYAVCKDICIPQEKVIILNQLLQDYKNRQVTQLINFWKSK
ncbi:MAG: protein-disulfide reductase DsbD domain-containing protein [Ehrlichia sp.]